MRVLVAGALANKPGNGGAAWTRLSFVLGLQRLGVDVRFVEQLEVEDPRSLDWFRRVTERFGLSRCATLLVGNRAVGAARDELAAFADGAELLVNLSGHLTDERIKNAPRRRAYVDADPGFTQIWESSGIGGSRLEGHDVFFTVGLNIGRDACPIPTLGHEWLPLLPPVVLSEWDPAPRPGSRRFTTVASWRGPYGPLELGGRTYGLKVHEFRKVLELPRRAAARFELALAIDDGDEADRRSLLEHGWQLVDPGSIAAPDDFREYVRGSWAEFSVAQGVYAGTRSGWFSDRTARYLASGRPALVQDTGLSDSLPVGDGLLDFATLDDAVRGVERLSRDYDAHAAAARGFAEAYLDSDKVLTGLLERAGVA